MAILQIIHGRQKVLDADGRTFEAYVTTYECERCRLHVGTSAVDVALVREMGVSPARESDAWVKAIEEKHQCAEQPLVKQA